MGSAAGGAVTVGSLHRWLIRVDRLSVRVAYSYTDGIILIGVLPVSRRM
jgi:hypothetical protein